MRVRLQRLIRAALIGVLGGLTCVAFRFLLRALQLVITGHSGSLAGAAALLPWWLRILIPTAGGLLAGLVLHYGPRFFHGQHPTDYLEAVRLGDGRIPPRPTLWRTASSVLSIVTGASIGREGSMVQLAALAASLTGQHWRVPPARLRQYVACGVATGIATAYQAPLAGAFFAAEIVLGALTLNVAGPLLIAAAVGAATSHIFLGSTPLFAVPPVRPLGAADLFPGLLLSVAAGVLTPPYRRLLRAAEFLRRWPVPLLWSGLAVGLLSVVRPEVWGNGDTALQAVLHGRWSVQIVLLVLALRLCATAISVGSGAIGGVFTPTLFAGSVLGWLCGAGAHGLYAAIAPPQTYAVLGTGCFLAAVTHAPLMAVLMTIEMTGDATLVVPLLLCSVVAWQISRALWPTSLYSIASPQPLEVNNDRIGSAT